MNALCTICGRPSDTYLCGEHVDELADALRQIGNSSRDEPSGGIPAVVVERQGLYEDLLDCCWRLTRTGASRVPTSRGGEAPLPLANSRATRLRDHVANVISTWARDVAERHGHDLPITIPAAATWLACYVDLVATHPAADECWHDIVPLPGRIRAAVDRRADMTYLGICSANIGGTSCPHDVYADTDHTLAQCLRCGTWHDIAHRRDVMLRAMEDQLLPVEDMRTVLTRYMPAGAPAASTMRKWAASGRLTQKPAHPSRPKAKRYRVGDVLDVIATQERHEQKGKPA